MVTTTMSPRQRGNRVWSHVTPKHARTLRPIAPTIMNRPEHRMKPNPGKLSRTA